MCASDRAQIEIGRCGLLFSFTASIVRSPSRSCLALYNLTVRCRAGMTARLVTAPHDERPCPDSGLTAGGRIQHRAFQARFLTVMLVLPPASPD